MSKQFIKAGALQLLNGGYLSNADENPVFNADFVKAQFHAEYIVTFAEMAKGKDFVGKKANSLETLRAEVSERLSGTRATEFVSKPSAIKRPTQDNLAKEALAFMDFQENTSKVEKINRFMQQFIILKEFEDFGLFFEEDVCKLNKIYTVKEILKAVTDTIDLLN